MYKFLLLLLNKINRFFLSLSLFSARFQNTRRPAATALTFLSRVERAQTTLTVARHSQPEALLQPAVLAPVPVHAVHHAVLVARTLVVDHGRLRPPEEALAALARDHAVVHAAGLVAAHLARYDLDLSCSEHKQKKNKNT